MCERVGVLTLAILLAVAFHSFNLIVFRFDWRFCAKTIYLFSPLLINLVALAIRSIIEPVTKKKRCGISVGVGLKATPALIFLFRFFALANYFILPFCYCPITSIILIYWCYWVAITQYARKSGNGQIFDTSNHCSHAHERHRNWNHFDSDRIAQAAIKISCLTSIRWAIFNKAHIRGRCLLMINHFVSIACGRHSFLVSHSTIPCCAHHHFRQTTFYYAN